MELKFKRDTSFRKQVFTPESFAHPAKMNSHLLLWIVRHYTASGETILDPMAGSGTTMLACGLGRNVVLVELEEKFCKMCKSNWEKVSAMPQLGYEMGECNIVQGDARQLEGLLVDKCIFSPPYAKESFYYSKSYLKYRPQIGRDPTKPSQQTEGYGDNPSNISNLPYGSIDKIVTSPPYEETLTGGGQKHKEGFKQGQTQGKDAFKGGYTGIDAVVTSPPYEGFCECGIDKSGERLQAKIDKGLVPKETARALTKGSMVVNPRYSHSADNIGNLKSDSYLEAMLQVYQQCWSVLKNGGLMILVTKNFIRNKKIVRLDTDTIKLCEQAGFTYLERRYRKLPSQSFWRVIYHQKHPEVEQIKYEDILVFQRSETER